MKSLDPFKIATVALTNKKHHFTIESSPEFFQRYEQDLIEKGQFKVEIALEKSETMIQIELEIEGFLNLICDRTFEEFEEPLMISEKLIYKYGDHHEDLGDNLYLLDRKDPTINLYQDIFDFIALKVPMKKLHPRFRKELEEGNDEGDGVLLYSTLDEIEENEMDEEEENPQWKELKKLFDKGNETK